ncbi:MAG: hypothetical protein AB1665_05690 [Candidatus Thermoplasmatota archaeon]
MRGAKRERILRVILNKPDGTLTKYMVAKLSGSSIGWTIEYLQALERKKIIKGTKVLDTGKAFNLWEKVALKPQHFDFFVQSPRDFLTGAGLDYAVTTYQAENLLNHYLFVSRVDAYVRADDLPKWKPLIARNGLAGKGNLRLLIADEHVFYERQKVNGMWLVSRPQLLLDLRREGGVCREAYDMMVAKDVRKKRN